MKNTLFKLRTLHKLVMREFLKTNKDLQNIPKPTPTQIQIMEYLIKHQNEKVYQKDLEQVLNLKRATISGVLNTMEKNKFIKRIKSKTDTRVNKITLNEQTKKIYEENKKNFKKVQKKLTHNLSNEEIKCINNILDKMINNIKKEGI